MYFSQWETMKMKVKFYNPKLWKNYEKTEYLYDLSIEKDEVIDRGHIIDEKEDSVNLILEKKYYLYDGKKWILTKKTKYLYDKK